MNYKRSSFCGPAGDGVLSRLLSYLVATALSWLGVNLEKSCGAHDLDWDDGPNTVDDIGFALSVYQEIKQQKGPALAGVMSLVGFVLVRLTAIVYKLGR